MKKYLLLLGVAISLNLSAAMPYTAGDNLVRNPAMKAEKKKWEPDEWSRNTQPEQAKANFIHEGNSWQIYFLPNQEYIFQARIRQFQIKVEPGNAYEFTVETKAGPGASMTRDFDLLGTGVWMRQFLVPPLTEWTKCRQVFWIPKDVKEKGIVTLLLQNRSTSPVWYRNPSLRKISISQNEVAKYAPEIKFLPVSENDSIILPGTTKKFLQYIVNGIPEEDKNNYRFEFRLYKNNNKFIKGKVNGNRVEIPMHEVPIGNVNIQLLVYDKRDGALIENKKVAIERLAEIPASLKDYNKIIPIKTPKGDKIVPIGIYAGLSWNFSLQKLKDYGFNTIHTYGTDSYFVREENFKLLNEAEKLGVWVMMGLPPKFQRDKSYLPLLTNWLYSYRRYPAIIAYYSDEIVQSGTSVEHAAENYQTVKKADPTRPHWFYEKPIKGLEKTTDCLQIDLTSKKMAQVIKLRMGNIPVMHCYGQLDFEGNVASSLDYNQYNFVMPFINGANGIFYFGLVNLEDPRGNLEYKILAPRVLNCVKRFSQIAPALISEETLPEWTKQIRAKGYMDHKAFAWQGKVYIFCAVEHTSIGDGTISLPIPAGKQLRDVLNDQVLEANQELSITLQPGQGRIIEVK